MNQHSLLKARSSRCGFVLHEYLRKGVSALLVWVLVMVSLPPRTLAGQQEWRSSIDLSPNVTHAGQTQAVSTPETTLKTKTTRPRSNSQSRKPAALAESQRAMALLADAQALNASLAHNSTSLRGIEAGTPQLSIDEIKRLGRAFYSPGLRARAAARHRGHASGRRDAGVLLARAEAPSSSGMRASGISNEGMGGMFTTLPSSAKPSGLDLSGFASLPLPLRSFLLSPATSTLQAPTQVAGLAVYVGYADNLRPNPNFPVPWQGSPNTTFIGQGPAFDAGAIRLDNNSSSPITINDVFVTVPGWTTSATRDAHGNGTADLWGSFTIAPNSTVILTQTNAATENFDTSDFGVRGCGDALANGQAPVPTVQITINGVATTFNDTGHVLDTGGFDLACRGNESLQWRLIGTAGIENQTSHVSLTPPTSIQPVGVTYTATAQVTDASNSPTPNVIVNFLVLSGPNAGKTGSGTTDAQGNAIFSYTSALLGTDILRASVTNFAGGTIESEQVTTTWTSADPCPAPTQPPDPSQTVLVYAGPSSGEFNDPLTLAAQLTDANGLPLAGRSLTLVFAAQTFQATTDGNGMATVNIPAAPAPGAVPLTVSFAGEASFKPAQLNTSIAIAQEETALRYSGGTLLGTAAPQQVSAVLTDPVTGLAIANEPVTFRVGTVQAQAVTNAQGIAAATLILGADQTSGPSAVQVTFAGDNLYKPSITGAQVTVYLSTSFVVWGGNQNGLHLGQDVNFWGNSWASQVTAGNFTGNPSFKGLADPVSQIHVCEAAAGSGGPLDDQCWSSKTGQSFPPPITVPAFIEVIISTAITKSDSEIYGNIAAAAVCQVDPTPVYGPDPGQPGFCKLLAVVEDGANVFPQPPSLSASQSQPAIVLPGQNFNVTAQITNTSSAAANSVTVSESFDGLTPPAGNQSFSSILNGQQQTATFQVAAPAVPIRQSSESTVDYQARLATIDGRLFTSTGTVTFSDAFGQPFVPISISSFSRLQLPELRVGISGPACVGPGSQISYKVNVANVGTAEADNVAILLNMPDGTNASASIASIAAGSSVTTTVNLAAPVISAKQANETDDQYRARLAAIDGSDLVAMAKVNWQDGTGNAYGPIEQKIVTTVERVPILTVTPQGPATILPGQKATLNFSVQNVGGGNSSQVLLQVTNPDGSVVNLPPLALQGGQAASLSSTFTVPGAAKAAGESDAAYQARLASLDNSSLKFTTQLRWFDAATNSYGPTGGAIQATEILPVLTASLTGPAATFSTNNINYSLRIANLGHADASTFAVGVRLPDGSTLNPFPASPLVAGSAAQISIPFGIPQAQPTAPLTALASLNWTDAAANAYGPQSAAVVSANTHLDLPVVNAGADQSITTASTTLNGSVTDTLVPAGGVLVSSWTQISGPAPATFASASSPATQITFTTNGTYVVQLTGSVTNTSLPLTSSARATIVVNAPTAGGGGAGSGTIVNQVVQGQIGQPLAGTVVQGQVPVTVAAGATLTAGVLDFWPVSNPSNVQILNPNTTGNGVIGTFDATTLQNGTYIVRLTSTLADGTTQASLVSLSVIGENKPGRFTKTITDMRVPVAGIPVTINRTYDSLKRSQSSDFGFGWSLTTSVDLSVDASNNVTFTFNGQRVTFFFTPQTAPAPFNFLLTPAYTPQTGLHGTLSSDGCGLLVATAFLCFPGSSPYQPTTFTYTNPYGRVYILGADGQLKSMKDLNGNTLTVTPSGISSSAGSITIAFVRDGQGRITQMTDPNGNSNNYGYDSAGNLATVSKPGMNSPATYSYSADHLLTQETDPRGNASSTSYFPDGRLESITDPLGNVTQYSYDIANNTTTTTNPDGGTSVRTNNSLGKMISYQDPLGRIMTFTYDANQNLVSRTNTLGKTSTFTYDSNGNLTSKTDPLGNTIQKNYDNFGHMITITDAIGQTMSLSHDGQGNVTSITDGLGQFMAATWDSRGNRTSSTLPSGFTAQYSYDTFGNPVSYVDYAGFASTRQYDSLGRWIGTTDGQHGTITFGFDAAGNYAERRDPLGNTLRYQYDAVGNRVSETDPNGNTFQHVYDAANRLIQTTYPDGTTRLLNYDFAGRVTSRTNESGQVTRYAYDTAGQLTSVTAASGTSDAVTFSFTYDPAGRMTTVTDPRNAVTTMTYDDADRMTSVIDPLGRTTSATYNGNGQLTTLTEPNGATTKISYDARNRPNSVTNPDGTLLRYAFDAVSLHSMTDEAGKITSYTYDARSQVASVTDALGHTVTYTRDAVGNLIGVTDANRHTTQYQYDAADRPIKKILPDGSFEQYTYDANNSPIAIRLTDGNVNRYAYDSSNRIIQITYFDGTVVSFTYTPTGKRKTATTPQGTTQYGYDALDRLVSITHPSGQAIAYKYDPSNNIVSIASPGGISKYQYDLLGRLIAVVDPLGSTTVYSYDQGGRMVQRALPNGVVTNYAYDLQDRLTAITHSLGSAAPFESFQYTLGPSGNRLNVVEADGRTTNWTYDDANRLLSETITDINGTTQASNAFTYDAVGNRTSLVANGVTTSYQYNVVDQLVSAGSAQYSYDARGNLTQINDTSGTTTYSYDAANRLNAVALPGAGVVATYTFDADGRWASRGAGPAVRKYFWDELSMFGDVVAETDGADIPQATYTLGGTELVQQTGNGNHAASYYLHDGLGNVIGLTDPNGVLTDRYRYDAFGTRTLFTGTSTNNYLYRGQRNDELSGLLYLRSRDFAPRIGRFTTRDTANFDLADPQDLNRYTYAAANPINRYDPTGYTADEYALVTQESAENSEINGYYTARVEETLISCFVMYVFAQMAKIPLALSSTRLVNGKPNNIINYTVAFGHIIEAPLDELGRDEALDPEIPFERAILLSKSWMFRNAPRQDVYSRSGRSDGSPGRNVDNWLAMFFPEFYAVPYQNVRGADLCAYHAELRILRWAQPPRKALLSVGASRPVCLNCQIQLWRGGVDCAEVRGSNAECLTSNWMYNPPGLPVH